jgi:O-antigen chain-terminating methyltransferase
MKFWPPSTLWKTLRHIAELPRRLKNDLRAAEANIASLQLNQQRHHQQLQAQHQQLQKDHDASVAWIQQMYPEIVSAVGKKLEQKHFDQLTQDVFAAIHSEVGAFSDRLDRLQHAAVPAGQSSTPAPSTAQADNIKAKEDSRSAGFYLALERRFRGTAEEISGRAQPYLNLLQSNPSLYAPVLDIGSGRGEWLALLAQENLAASGVDLNPINGHYCRSRGLDVRTGDAIAYLASLAPASLGVVTAFHLVEHLPFATLLALTDEILRVLKPGGLLIYETPNPENILVATQYFWIDPTHIKPLPPDLLHFLVMQRGFTNAEIRRLHPGEPSLTPDATLQKLLSGPRDYAVIATKPPPAQ